MQEGALVSLRHCGLFHDRRGAMRCNLYSFINFHDGLSLGSPSAPSRLDGHRIAGMAYQGFGDPPGALVILHGLQSPCSPSQCSRMVQGPWCASHCKDCLKRNETVQSGDLIVSEGKHDM